MKRRHPEGPLKWQFPAGVVKAGEKEDVAVKREIYSETGIGVKIVRKLGDRVHPQTLTRLTYWLCRYISGEASNLDSKENSTIRWATGKESEDLITSDIFPSVLAELHKRIIKGRIK